MASLAVGAVERLFKAGLAIRKAAQTVRRNRKECRDIERCVARIGALLVLLNERTGLMQHPAISDPLQDLAESLEEALDLITECQETSAVRRFLAAGDMAKQLRRVQDDILRKLMVGNFAYNVQITITLANTIRCAGGSHPLLTQLQNAAEMEMYSSHSTTGDAGSYDNEIITMVTTGTEAHSAPSSSVTEFTLSETVATHHVSEENMNGGNSYTGGIKQKIVFKVSMPCEKSQRKAKALVAKLDGVSSVGITGDSKDRLEVIGYSVDAISLVSCLCKKIGPTQILRPEEAKDKKPDERKPEEPKVQSWTSMTFSEATPQCNNQHQEHAGTSVHQAKASGDLIEKPQLQLQELRPEAPPARVNILG